MIFSSKRKKLDSEEEQIAEALAGPNAPWLNARNKFYDELLNARIQTKNWQRQAILSWLFSIGALLGMVYVASLPKIKPYIVEVDQLGRVRAVRALSENDTRIDPQRIVVSELTELITNLRTVTTDRDANNRNISRGLSRLTGAAYTYAKTELKKAPPNEVGTTKTVQVKTYPPLKISDNTWQIEWDEISQNFAGEPIGLPEKWKASITFKLEPNLEDEEAFAKNPYGFHGYQFNWTRIEK